MNILNNTVKLGVCMNKWFVIGSIIEKIDTKKRWSYIRQYIAHKIINALEEM